MLHSFNDSFKIAGVAKIALNVFWRRSYNVVFQGLFNEKIALNEFSKLFCGLLCI